MSETMSIATIVAVLISLFVEWFPGVAAWWEKFTEAQKRGIMALTVAVVTVAVAGLNCVWKDVCPADWPAFLNELLLAFIVAASAQQGIHLLSKRS